MEQLLELTKQLTLIPSPTGFTDRVISFLETKLQAGGYEPVRNNKGGLIVTVAGQDSTKQRFVTAHIDTLGAIVRAIKPSGRLKLELVGGFRFNAIEGENCTIHTQTGAEYTGTILMHQTSVHVYKDAGTAERNQENMEVRIDAKTKNAEETKALGIQIGDFISFDPRTQITKNGYLKSRHLDDKVSAAILLNFLLELKKTGDVLPYTTRFLFSNNEEIGYGGNSNITPETVEYVAVDMGAMGDDQQTDEYTVSICVKDSSGPYHLGLRNHFTALCEEQKIAYQLDIYPFYGSDASAAMRAGADVRHGLIGAGIESSHAYERTHLDSVTATYRLVEAYLFSELAQ